METASAAETKDVAAAIAGLARPGDLLLLLGDLGAGKTAFTQGLGNALGVTQPITSPTFTLAQQYEGTDMRVHHLDVYRLEQLDEVSDLGLPELLDDDAVVVIEWGDAIVPMLPNNYLEIRITFGDGDDDRVLVLEPVGSGWSARRSALETAIAELSSPPSTQPGDAGDAQC